MVHKVSSFVKLLLLLLTCLFAVQSVAASKKPQQARKSVGKAVAHAKAAPGKNPAIQRVALRQPARGRR